MDKVHRIHRIHSAPVEQTLEQTDVSETQEDQIVPPRKEEYSSMNTIIIGVYVVLLILGVGTGYLLSGGKSMKSTSGQAGGMVNTKTVVGSTDTTTFKDSAEGTIEKGGFDGEGTHKLIREGGPSQTAYLISSVVDLDTYAGKKIRVWGQTIAAKKAQWLMDVGKIEMLE